MFDQGNGRQWTPPRVRTVIILCFLLIAANLFDAWATLYALGHGAAADVTEVNPIMRRAIMFGSKWFYLLKITGAVLPGFPLAFLSRRYRIFWWILVIITLFYTHLAAYTLAILMSIMRSG